MTEDLAALAAYAGLLPEYRDVTGTLRRATADTQMPLLRALGYDIEHADAGDQLRAAKSHHDSRRLAPWYVITSNARPGSPDLQGDWQICFEDGSEQDGRGALPPLPLGIHHLTVGSDTTWLLSAPNKLPLPPRCWGLMVPLWGLSGSKAGGLGDYSLLGQFAQDIAPSGAAFLGLNPVHAGFPDDPGAFSPYQPSHRRRLNPLFVEGGAAASRGPLVDYPAETSAKQRALRKAFEQFNTDPGFDRFVENEGPSLRLFALHQALSARYGPYWTDWPATARSPETAIRQAHDLEQEISFQCWAQWQAETQLLGAQTAAKSAGMAHGLYLDLAVGTHPAGAETWEDRTSFAQGVSLGAPPDAFGPSGQTWNLAPLSPKALIDSGFRALAETLRKQLRFSGVLRIDHILGFDRAFWVPETGAPGGYVTMPRDAMLAVARIEAARAGAVIVGEDLGVVPDGLRDRLRGTGILGCTLAMFERRERPLTYRKPGAYPAASIASFSTHDLPTWRGWREGVDLQTWAGLGTIAPEDLPKAKARRGAEVAAFDRVSAAENPASPDVLHEFLAASRARMVAVQAETLLDDPSQPNLPGTVYEHPNWQRRLSVNSADLARSNALKSTARIMQAAGRGEITK